MKHALALGIWALTATAAAAVEEPPYTLISRWDGCELRAYPALVVAETEVAAGRDASGWSGFRTLAGYIFGANAKSEKIEMTAPVLETPAASGWTIRFTLPRGRTLSDLPAPGDAQVKLRLAPPQRLGVATFSGVATDADFAAKARDLLACLAAHGLQATGPAALAQYDPPWTLGPFRRNEAMVGVK